MFGVFRQVGAYDECSFYCSRFELATAGPQDHWSLVLCTMHTICSIKAPLHPLAARTPHRRFRPRRAHFQRPPHSSSARAQKPATSPLISSKRLVLSVSSFSVNFTASIFSTWAPHYQTRHSRRPYSGPCLGAWWLLRKSLELAEFLRIVFRLQHYEQIVGYTGFPTNWHDNIWMEVNDKKEHTAVLSVGMVRSPFHPVAPQELSLTISTPSVQTAIPWGCRGV